MDQKHRASAHQVEVKSAAPIYTQPALRARLRDEIMAGNRGGAPGEWNTRKAELLAREYRQAGGGYTFAKRSPAQSPTQEWPGAQQPGSPAQVSQPARTDFATTSRPAANGQPRHDAQPEL